MGITFTFYFHITTFLLAFVVRHGTSSKIQNIKQVAVAAKCPADMLEPCVVDQTNMIIENEGLEEFPEGYTRLYQFRKNPGICQLRLDFDVFELHGPEVSGRCNTEAMTVGGLILCGSNADQHAYFDFGDSCVIDALVRIAANSSGRYRVRNTFIECNSGQQAPPHCLQFYRMLQGTVKSFNYPTQTNNLQYSVCVETAFGMNRILWSTCPENNHSPIPFLISEGGVEGAEIGTDCMFDFVQLNGLYRYCGNRFNTVMTSAKPFLLYVNFDGVEGASVTLPTNPADCPVTLIDPFLGGTWECGPGPSTCTCYFKTSVIPPHLPEYDNTGFCLQYTQLQ